MPAKQITKSTRHFYSNKAGHLECARGVPKRRSSEASLQAGRHAKYLSRMPICMLPEGNLRDGGVFERGLGRAS